MTRSLGDFAKIVEIFDKRNVSFVSVTQQFNTTTSMGRLSAGDGDGEMGLAGAGAVGELLDQGLVDR